MGYRTTIYSILDREAAKWVIFIYLSRLKSTLSSAFPIFLAASAIVHLAQITAHFFYTYTSCTIWHKIPAGPVQSPLL